MASAAPAAPAAAPQAPAGNDASKGLTTPSAPTSAGQGAASPPIKAKPIPKQMIKGVRQWTTPPAEAALQAPTPETPPTAPEPVRIKIGEKEYTQEQLEKAFLSLEGRTKANARDAEAWRKYQREAAERQPARPETVPQRAAQEAVDRGQPQTPQDQKTEQQQKRWIEAQGEPFWNQVKQVHAQHGPEVALAFALDKFDSSIQERAVALEQQILAKLAPALTPILQEHVEAKNKNFAQDIWTEFSTYTNDETGEPLFPELAQNPRLAQIAGTYWLALRQKFGEKFAMSEYGLYSAYRDAQAYLTGEAEQGKNAGNAAQAVLDAIEHDRKAGALTAVQAPSAPPVTAPEANPHDDDAIKKRIREARGGFMKTGTGINLGVRPFAGG